MRARHAGRRPSPAEVEDARGVRLGARLHRARELVMPVRLARPSELLERAAEGIVRIVVSRGELLDDHAKLALGVLPAREPEVGDAERFADRRLVRLEPLRPLERHRRLRGHSGAEPLLPFAKQVVGVGHALRYGKFSRTRSAGAVRSRVAPIWIADTDVPASIASWNTSPSSCGGRPGSGRRCCSTGEPRYQSGAPVRPPASPGAITRTTRPSSTCTRVWSGRPGWRRTAIAPSAPCAAARKRWTSPAA